MTIIVWDGLTLAADRRMVMGDTISETTKITKAKDGSLLGFAGHPGVGAQMCRWYDDEDDIQPFPEQGEGPTCLIVVKPDKTVTLYEGSPYPIPVEGPFAAIGSGVEAALAALHCDANAVEVVAVVSKVNASCGNGVDYLRH